MAIIHFGIGILVVSLGSKSETWTKRYDNICDLGPHNDTGAGVITFDLGEVVSGRFFLYYELEGLQHNHFRFAGSYSENQMLGKYVEEASECSPLETIDDHPIFPCGLRPYYFFNDSFTALTPGTFSETDIAWSGEIGGLFKEPSDEYPEEQRYLLNYTAFPGETVNEHFVVWMRTAKDSHFRKLWARAVVEELGRFLRFSVSCDYPWSIYDGPRRLVLVKVGGLGGRNLFIGIVNFVLFALCGVFALDRKSVV